MKILSIVLLVLSALAVGFMVWQTYFPPSTCPYPQTLVACAQVVPNCIAPIWWPPIAILAWIFSFLRFLKGSFKQSILWSVVVIVSLFVFSWFGARGFWGTC